MTAKRKRRRRAVPPLLTDAPGAAAALCVAASVFYQLDNLGAVPAPVTLGPSRLRRRRWSVHELEEWVRAGAPPRHEWQAIRGKRP
jgi:predicted DNA-binding transcriptional regulator AlpA